MRIDATDFKILEIIVAGGQGSVIAFHRRVSLGPWTNAKSGIRASISAE
jgi:hypothetical protein